MSRHSRDLEREYALNPTSSAVCYELASSLIRLGATLPDSTSQEAAKTWRTRGGACLST